MVLKLRSFGLLFACTSGLAVAGIVSAQPPAPTADRPHLAKDAKQAMDFLATWARITSGEEYFKDATYVGSEGCKGSGCHDQQLQEWRTTWHSKILTVPSTETVKGDFNNVVIPFQNVRAVAKGHDADLAKLQNVPVKFDVRTENANGKFFFVIVDPTDTGSPKQGQKYEVTLVVGSVRFATLEHGYSTFSDAFRLSDGKGLPHPKTHLCEPPLRRVDGRLVRRHKNPARKRVRAGRSGKCR